MCFWHIDDVLETAKEIGLTISKQDAENVAKWIEKHHDANEGINWDIIKAAINEVIHN